MTLIAIIMQEKILQIKQYYLTRSRKIVAVHSVFQQLFADATTFQSVLLTCQFSSTVPKHDSFGV